MSFIYSSSGYPIGHTSLINQSDGLIKKSPVKITSENGGLKIVTPYSSEFVNTLKAMIPATGRKWDAFSKAWLVSAKYKIQVEHTCIAVFGVAPQMPNVAAESDASFETTIRAEYVGNSKSDSGTSSVFCEGGWNARIPETILRDWFKQNETNAGTLYALLGCDETASGDDIKRAYKRAARQWHPDVCKEPNAREMFEQVKTAFDTLSNFETRNKYNAGLFFERIANGSRKSSYATFTPMLRCGLITAVGKRTLGTFIVEKIVSWDDIVNERGQTMVSFWSGTAHSVMWV